MLGANSRHARKPGPEAFPYAVSYGLYQRCQARFRSFDDALQVARLLRASEHAAAPGCDVQLTNEDRREEETDGLTVDERERWLEEGR